MPVSLRVVLYLIFLYYMFDFPLHSIQFSSGCLQKNVSKLALTTPDLFVLFSSS